MDSLRKYKPQTLSNTGYVFFSRRCLKHDNSFICAIFKPDFHNFLLEYNPIRDTFVMGMVFSVNLAMTKMYPV